MPIASKKVPPQSKRQASRPGLGAGVCVAVLIVVGLANKDAAAEACTRAVVSADPEYPPFAWYDGKTLRGAAVDITVAVLERLRLPTELRYVGPFPRVLHAAQDGEVDIISELKDTPERKAYLVFPATPIFINPVAVFTRSDRQFAFGNWDDLVGRRGGITLANKFGGGFDEFLLQRLSVETAPRIDSGFAMLAQNRIDYFVTGYYPGVAFLAGAHREPEFAALKPFVTATENFIGVAKASPCAGLLPDIDAALAELVHGGTVQRMIDANLEAWRTNPVSLEP